MSEFDHGFHRMQALQATYAELAAPQEARNAIFNALGQGAIIRDGLILDDFSTWTFNQGIDGPVMDVVDKKTKLLDAYQPYASDTRGLIAELPLHDEDSPWRYRFVHDEHIANGYYATVFNHQFLFRRAIVRLFNLEEHPMEREPDDTPASLVNQTMGKLLRVQNWPGFEQILAASYIDGTVVSDVAEGKATGFDFSEEWLQEVTDKHLIGLIGALGAMFDEQLTVHSTTKIFFSPEKGFTILNPIHTGVQLDVGDFGTWCDVFVEGNPEESLEAVQRRLTLFNRFEHLSRERFRHWISDFHSLINIMVTITEKKAELEAAIEQRKKRPGAN